jgi:hypothetical protein
MNASEIMLKFAHNINCSEPRIKPDKSAANQMLGSIKPTLQSIRNGKIQTMILSGSFNLRISFGKILAAEIRRRYIT